MNRKTKIVTNDSLNSSNFRMIVISIVVFIFNVILICTTLSYKSYIYKSIPIASEHDDVDWTAKISADKLESVVKIISTSNTSVSSGTGFVIFSNEIYTYVMTNRHVIENTVSVGTNNSFTDLCNNNKIYNYINTYDDSNIYREVKTIAVSSEFDIAILQITTSDNIKSLTFDNSSVVHGDYVLAIGNALGEGISVTQGIVSNPTVYINSYETIQFDAAINSGNSGGPLLNINGDVIGMNTWKQQSVTDSIEEALAFALKTKDLQEFVNSSVLGFTI